VQATLPKAELMSDRITETITITLLTLGALIGSVTAHAQMQIPEQATVQKITDNLHVVMVAGGNIAVSSGPDGVFIVDADLKGASEVLEAGVATFTDQPVSMVLNTHWHFDHAGGNEHFGTKGALIMAQDNTRARIASKQRPRWTVTGIPASPQPAIPIISYDTEMTLHINGMTIRAEHVRDPAHTDGDSLVFFEEANAVHMGDLFFNGLYPVIDINAGGSAGGMVNAINALLPRLDSETILIPGHGPVSDVAGLKRFRDMLATVDARIKLLLAEGKSADEVIGLKPTVNYDAEWAWSFMPPERWTKLMYDSAAAEAGGKGD